MRWWRFGTAHYRALVLAAALGLGAWWRWPAATDAPPQPAEPLVARAPPAPGASADAAPLPPMAPHQRVAVPDVKASAPQVEHLCGLGTVPRLRAIDPMRPDPLVQWPDHAVRLPLQVARERAWATLESGGLRQRLVARAWRDLQSRLGAPGSLDAAVSAALVQEAAASGDPVAHGTALRLCHHLPDPVGCQSLLVAAALRADPGNARWHAQRLPLAADAPAAWESLLQARAWRSDFGEMTAIVRASLPPDLPRYLSHMLAFEGFALDAALVDNLSPAMRRCRLDSPAADRAPREDCDRLAHLMVERSDTLLTVTLGRRAAEAAGWPPERLAALNQDIEALRVDPVPQQHRVQPLGCTAIDATERYFDDLARDGELATLRALIRR